MDSRVQNPVFDDVVAVLLAYGDRTACLQQVVDRLVGMNLGEILVVQNGPFPMIGACVDAYMASGHPVRLLVLEQNTGSAGGYNAGLDAAMKTNPDASFFWLLDDDNLPEPDALIRLRQAYADQSGNSRSGGPVVVAYRPGQGSYVRMLAQGHSWQNIFVTRSSFLSFHVVASVRRLLRRFGRGMRRFFVSPDQPPDRLVPLARTPLIYYGGMLLPRSVLALSGLPKSDLFIYGDDSEFSHRLNQVTDIFLVSGAMIHDLEDSWYVATAGNRYVRLLTADSDFRVYYQVRNNVWFQNHCMMRSRWMYRINRMLLLFVLKMTNGLSVGTKERFRLIMLAIADGEAGRLGRRDDLGF